MDQTRRTSSMLLAVAPPEQATAHRLLAARPAVCLRAGQTRPAAELAAAALLVVDDGIVLVSRSRNGGRGRRTVLAIAGHGDMLAPPRPHERLAALSDCTLTAVAPDAMHDLLALPSAARAIALGLLETLFERHESLAQLSCDHRVERLREKLLQLARRHGRVVPGGVRIDLPLTHELLAQTVNSARETVTLGLSDLQREGFLVRDGRAYRLCVPPESLAS